MKNFIFLGLSFYLLACSSSQLEEDSTRSAGASEQGDSFGPGGDQAQKCQNLSLVELPFDSENGSIEFTLIGNDILNCTVSGYVVGFEKKMKMKLDTDGDSIMSMVPPGVMDIMVFGEKLQSGASTPADIGGSNLIGEIWGRRIDGIQVEAGKNIEVTGELLPLANLRGRVTNAPFDLNENKALKLDENNLQGIRVSIKGTSISTQTNEVGEYQLNYVPQGEHTLNFSREDLEALSSVELKVLVDRQKFEVEDLKI